MMRVAVRVRVGGGQPVTTRVAVAVLPVVVAVVIMVVVQVVVDVIQWSNDVIVACAGFCN